MLDGDQRVSASVGGRKKSLRLWAWQLTPRTGADYPVQFGESYKCDRDCKTPTGWDKARRKAMGCTRPRLPVVRWDLDAYELLQRPSINPVNCWIYRGRQPDAELEGTEDMIPVNPETPHEQTADGCPGGWYRTAWVNGVARYTRRRTEHGGRVTNPFFDAAPWQVQEAVMYLELEQERHAAYRAETNYNRWKSKNPTPKKGRR